VNSKRVNKKGAKFTQIVTPQTMKMKILL